MTLDQLQEQNNWTITSAVASTTQLLFSGKHAVGKLHGFLMSLKTHLDLKLKIVTVIMKIPQALLINSTSP